MYRIEDTKLQNTETDDINETMINVKTLKLPVTLIA